MDACEYDLLITMVKESGHLAQNGLQADTAATTAGIRNNTVGAESIAPVLNFKKGASSVRKTRENQRLGCGGCADVIYLHIRRLILFRVSKIIQQ
jgi:hypothetical protein